MTDGTSSSAEDELAQLEASLAQQRQVAGENPDILYPAMADTLMGMAGKLADLGRHVESLAAAREGVEQFRAMAALDPGVFKVHLAAGLNNLSNRLYEIEGDGPARAAGDEAAELCRSLLGDLPEQARFVLVSTLLNQASRSWDKGASELALAEMAEAAVVFRDGGEGLQPFLGVMVEALHRNAMALAETRQWDQALAVRRLTIDLFAGPAPNPVAHLLALTLEQAAFAKSRDGDPQAALALVDEASVIARGLAEAEPAQYKLFLAQSLGNVASRRHEAGADVLALDAAVEAVGIFQEVAQTDAAAAIMPLAITLETFAAILIGLGHLEQARTVIAQRDELAALIQATEGAGE